MNLALVFRQSTRHVKGRLTAWPISQKSSMNSLEMEKHNLDENVTIISVVST